jgi:hypothetical protein
VLSAFRRSLISGVPTPGTVTVTSWIGRPSAWARRRVIVPPGVKPLLSVAARPVS